MTLSELEADWKVILRWLPDLQASARETGLIKAQRGIKEAEIWLRLLLMHIAGGLSLKQTAGRAREQCLATLSPVALHKRLVLAQPWLHRLCSHLLKEQNQYPSSSEWPQQWKFRLVDATDINEPGATGTDWRIHYSLRLPEMLCDHYQITDKRGGEKLGRFVFAPGEVILADRGYNHREGAAKVLQAGAHLVMRLSLHNFPLEDESGGIIRPLESLQSLAAGETWERPVRFVWRKKSYEARLCVLRKSEAATEQTLRKIRRKAGKSSLQAGPAALSSAPFVMVLTTLPPAQWSTGKVLEIYRCRWQVELAFKRMKSLMQLGCLPKTSDASARSWVQGKVLFALLIERLLWESKCVSPWGYRI